MLQPQLRLQSCLVTNASGANCGNKPNPSLEWDLLLDLHWSLPTSAGRTLVSNNGIASKKTHFSLSSLSLDFYFQKTGHEWDSADFYRR